MPKFEAVPIIASGHKLRLRSPGISYVGGDGQRHTSHYGRCIRCGAIAAVIDRRKVDYWQRDRDQGGCRYADRREMQ